MRYLLRRASVPSPPFVRSPSFSLTRSQSCTPVSAPAMHATTSKFFSDATRMISPAVKMAPLLASSSRPSLCPMTAAKCSSRPFGTRFTRFSMLDRDAEYLHERSECKVGR
jgi:hypothetical protein